jgi:hypothetical protein
MNREGVVKVVDQQEDTLTTLISASGMRERWKMELGVATAHKHVEAWKPKTKTPSFS